MAIDWSTIFTKSTRPRPGIAGVALDAALEELFAPFSGGERQEMYDRMEGDTDEERMRTLDDRVMEWAVPRGPLPADYLDVIGWSNGGDHENGDRYVRFYPMPGDIRSKMLDHVFPEYLPGALPFASDAGGRAYCFDMREPAVDGEYPILFVSLGFMDFDHAPVLADSFLEFCRDDRYPGDV